MRFSAETDADELTPEVRLERVAEILAVGVLRLRRISRTENTQKISPDPLDVPPKTRLSVHRG
jgi:hypothetical protein